MSRRKMIDGRAYRMRRGRLVEIPVEWVGKTVRGNTIRKRPSKRIRKLRKCENEVNKRPYFEALKQAKKEVSEYLKELM